MSPLDKNSYSIISDSGCGISAFERPCQMLGSFVNSFNHEYIYQETCIAPNESIFIIDREQTSMDELRRSTEMIGYSVKCFSSFNEFQIFSNQYISGCALVSIDNLGIDAIELHRWIRQNCSTLNTVMISEAPPVEVVASCMRDGAVDFLIKPILITDLEKSLRIAMGNSRMNHCRRESFMTVRKKIEKLTFSEWKIANLTAQGYAIKQIANMLGRSESTIKIHRSRVFRKLKINSSAELLRMIDITRVQGRFENTVFVRASGVPAVGVGWEDPDASIQGLAIRGPHVDAVEL